MYTKRACNTGGEVGVKIIGKAGVGWWWSAVEDMPSTWGTLVNPTTSPVITHKVDEKAQFVLHRSGKHGSRVDNKATCVQPPKQIKKVQITLRRHWGYKYAPWDAE